MPNLESFFSRTFRPFYLLTGAGTALIGAFALFPAWATPTIARLPFLVEYTIIIQHWGIMVGLMGLFMMGAAIYPTWRFPIALYSVAEKAFMVWLVLSNAWPFVQRSYMINEVSAAPGGLPYRWAIKSVILIAFAYLGLAVLSRLLRVCTDLFGVPAPRER